MISAGRTDDAIDLYAEALRNDPNNAVAYCERGKAFLDKGFWQLAEEDFTEAIRLNPNDADFFLYRGIDKQRIGDKAGADADIAEAKRLNPNLGK